MSSLLPSTGNGVITYGYLVDMVERYFDAVDKYDLDGPYALFRTPIDAGPVRLAR